MLTCYAFRASLPLYEESDPNGIRTRVTAVKGRCPGPLDDRVIKACAISELPLFHARQIAGRIWSSQICTPKEARSRRTPQRADSLIHSLSARESGPLRARLRLDARSELHARFGRGAAEPRYPAEAQRLAVRANRHLGFGSRLFLRPAPPRGWRSSPCA